MSNQPGAPPPHFVVVVPGYMGSKLRDRTTGEIVWIDVPGLVLNPFGIKDAVDELFDKMAYPNEDLEPAGIIDQVIFAPPLFKQEHYGRLLEALEEMGYLIEAEEASADDPVVYTFAYDWRQDNRISACQLGQAIEGWQARHPGAKAWIIGHSNGGIVARWYIEKEGGKDHVDRLFLMGSPWDGAPKAIQVMTSGLQVMFSRFFNLFDVPRRTRELIRTFPSFYQLIPHTNPFLRDPDNRPVDLFEDPTWLENEQDRQMLLDGLRFNQELGTTLSVETLCFFGYRKETTTGGIVRIDAGGRWTDIKWDRTEAGDGTVPERSAVHPNAHEKLPYCVGHGDIYVNTDVLEKLEWEMVRKYRAGVLAEGVTDRFRIMFEPQQDVYAPGETIQMWAIVEELDGAPVFDAQITVDLVWREALPGQEDVKSPAYLPSVELSESLEIAGRYEGSLAAPEQQGYYSLRATVQVEIERPVQLEELILIEAEPEQETLIELEGLEDDIDRPSPFLGPRKRRYFRTSDEDDQPDELSAAPNELSYTAKPDLGKPTQTADRAFEAEIPGHDMSKPLQRGRKYALAIGVNSRTQAGEITTDFDDEQIFEEDEEWVELWVHLSSRDFKLIGTGPQRLVVPRSGPSWNKAAFVVEPIENGVGEITVLIYKDNNCIQGMTINLNVGSGKRALVSVGQAGRPLKGAGKLRPRDVSLFVKKEGVGFDVTMKHTGVTQASLRFDSAPLESLIAEARKALQEIIYLYKTHRGIYAYQPKSDKDKGPPSIDLVYQTAIQIPEDVHQHAMLRLAQAGWDLYQEIFYGDDASADANLLGGKLRDLALEKPLKIQIISQEFMLPWGILYMSKEFPAENDSVDPQRFLGFKHIIEHAPLQQRKEAVDYEIPSENLAVSLYLNNTDIDRQLVNDQEAYWNKIASACDIQVVTHTKADELLKALNDPNVPDQIMYFYCHGKTQGLSESGRQLGSSLSLSERTRVTLKDLKRRAPTTAGVLESAPLVFINACESAELSPRFYAGFMPYFTRKGARGVIGTECKVPARFAAAWAQRFFEEFLAGDKSVGEIFLDLRREFLEEHNNLLGLLYALYCDGDTRLVPGLHL